MNAYGELMKPYSSTDLPSGLEALADMALDLRWTVRQTTDKIWEMLDAEAWEKTKNPYLILQNVSRARLEEVAGNERFIEEISNWQRMKRAFGELKNFRRPARHLQPGLLQHGVRPV